MFHLHTLGYTGIPQLTAIIIASVIMIKKSAKSGSALYALICPLIIMMSILSGLASCIIPSAIMNTTVLAIRSVLEIIMFITGLFGNIIITIKRINRNIKRAEITVWRGDVVTWNKKAKRWEKLS